MPHQNNIAALVAKSFQLELAAFKPGNVSLHAPYGHGMSAEDFTRSAAICTPLLCNPQRSLGERILTATRASYAEVGCNTHLGIILLFAPLIYAAEKSIATGNTDTRLSAVNLQQQLKTILQEEDQCLAAAIFTAIREISPGGLGKAGKYDVHGSHGGSLRNAMQYAARYDRIALQYTYGFSDIFATGLAEIKYFSNRWNSVEWAVVGHYLGCLGRHPDSHIARKHGVRGALSVMSKSLGLASRFRSSKEPETYCDTLSDFDHFLKRKGLNPGTTADLSAASVLLYLLTSMQKDSGT